ncbi:hypothetical protein [Silvibacterium acidisoli]|uniref:hypothetical protein n=1 Tax=Acidobacteriaceae bacterium ZG23-2 TaxID=2883246 RepID=UPI00406C94BA
MASVNRVIALVRSLMPLSRRVRILTFFIPRAWWFRTSVILASGQTRLTRLLGRRDAYLQDSLLLDYWLVQLTNVGPFPIPYEVIGARHLYHRPGDKNGLVYVGVHLPCYTVAIRSLEDLQAKPNLAIAAAVSIGSDGCYPLVGLKERLPAVEPGAAAFMRTKRELKANGAVVSMLDGHIGMPLTHQLLQLAGKIGARVIAFWTEFSADGTIRIVFSDPPYPVCDTDEKVKANMDAIHIERERILTSIAPPNITQQSCAATS